MDKDTILKALKIHVRSEEFCNICPLKDEEYCVDKLLEATIKELEGADKDTEKVCKNCD